MRQDPGTITTTIARSAWFWFVLRAAPVAAAWAWPALYLRQDELCGADIGFGLLVLFAVVPITITEAVLVVRRRSWADAVLLIAGVAVVVGALFERGPYGRWLTYAIDRVGVC